MPPSMHFFFECDAHHGHTHSSGFPFVPVISQQLRRMTSTRLPSLTLPLCTRTLHRIPGLCDCFNIDTKHPKIIQGSVDAQFGYTVQQHVAGGQKWLLVGAPFETSGPIQTGDVYKCPMNGKANGNCTRLNLGRISLTNVSERKNKMRLGMTLASNPKDNSFVACGPLWSYECGSSYYSTGICSKINSSFKFSRNIAPAFQRCETYMDIVIVLDGSNSIYPWFEVRDFLINILQKFYIGPGQIQVGIVQYGETVVHEFHLNDYRSVEEVVEAARNIMQRGGEETRTALGINVARSQAFKRGSRRGAKKVMIVITDGESHDSPDLKQVIQDSENDDITRYAIAVLGYYNRRGINPEAFLNEIKFIASDPDDKHFFNVKDESALKDIVDALGERIFSLEGTNKNETSFGLQMSQAGFSSHIVEDGILVGAVGAYDWNGAVLKETRQGKVIPPKSSYMQEFPEELKNHGAYLGYTVTSVVSAKSGRLFVAGAPRFNHTGKVIIFTLKNNGNLTILLSLKGQQIGSYYGSEIAPLDLNGDGVTDNLLVAAPMFFSGGWEKGKVYIYRITPQSRFVLEGALEISDRGQNTRFGSSLAPVPDLNGDTYNELVVGAPLEDDHRGAIYVFYGKKDRIQRKYKQRIGAAALSPGLQYFGWSVHGQMDLNEDGLVDLAVGSLGSAVLLWSRSVIHIHINVRFEPRKINIFNKDCRRGGRDVTCMAAVVCFNITATTPIPASQEVALRYSSSIEERRYIPRAVLDEGDRQQPRNLSLLPGVELCEHVYFHVLDTTDYGRPIIFAVEAGMRDLEEGPVLDDGWPTTVRSELPFWNGCDEDDHCTPDLVLQSRSDLLDRSQFCAQALRSGGPLCRQPRPADESERVLEATRRRMVVEARLENRGENAYNARLDISYSPNLHFSSLIVKDNSDIKIECRGEEGQRTERFCNVSEPFMKAQVQVSFRLEFEFSRSVFLDHVRVILETGSDGEDMTASDNSNNIFHQLKYETDLLFTRDSSPSRYEIKADRSLEKPASTDLPFNFTFQIHNLGFFPVRDLLLNIAIPQVTKTGNKLLQITDFYIDPTDGSRCVPPKHAPQSRVTPEDLSHLPQLNPSNTGTIPIQCSINLPAYRDIAVRITGSLHLQTLYTVKFKTLDLLTTASIELDPSSPMFLTEERPVRHIILEIRKEGDHRISIWIIIGSTLGGLLLLALLILALWKLGFFQRQKRKEEAEQEANGKVAEER
ncbi:integrin alpha-11 isoform X2 [Anguilla rostrata]|uniref:integrin alpha-11 isoform X2 n=1 Tax=Anguilla rostrata TaxID=7938 RepID=UPI0030CE96EC